MVWHFMKSNLLKETCFLKGITQTIPEIKPLKEPCDASDVCLEAEDSPRGSKRAALASLRRFDGSPQSCLASRLLPRPCLGLNVHYLSLVSSALPGLEASAP